MTVVIYMRATKENPFYSNWCHPLKIKVIIFLTRLFAASACYCRLYLTNTVEATASV